MTAILLVAFPALDRSQQIQGHRTEIDALRRSTEIAEVELLDELLKHHPRNEALPSGVAWLAPRRSARRNQELTE